MKRVIACCRLFLCCGLAFLPFLAGCQSDSEIATPALPAPDTPQTVAHDFFHACTTGDQAAALGLLAPLTRQAVVSSGSNPCRHVPPAGIDMSELNIETAGHTAYARYQWFEGEAAAVGELVLIQENNAWLIADSQVVYHQPTRIPPPAAPTIAPAAPATLRGTP
jgi:hypothetical protein